MNQKYLIINAGSSSLKFSLYEMPSNVVIANGNFEKIGQDDSFYTIKDEYKKNKKSIKLNNHTEAINIMLRELISNKYIDTLDDIKGIGHRVLHGGEKYASSVLIDENVIDDIFNLTKFGPLHHPGELAGIIAMRKALPDVPNVAVFDTAFHQTMPKENYIYPVPYEWYTKYGVRKYGFHGTSHKYITLEIKKRLDKEDVNLIICHIGSGASISAIKNGKCYDTTMGLTPLDGLMMGTRSGAIDPSIIDYICSTKKTSVKEVNNILNKQSGLLGMTGVSDLRDVEDLAANDNKNAILALKIYRNSIIKYIAQYYFELEGKIDAIVFTAGVGENSARTRKDIMDKLSKVIDVPLNDNLNNEIAGFKNIHEGNISNGSIPVYVIPTNEEKMILEDTYNIIKQLDNNKILIKKGYNGKNR